MEKEFVSWLRKRYSDRNRDIVLGIGDDAAVINVEQLQLVIQEGAKNDKGIYTMIPYKHMLKEGELEALMVFVRSLADQ